VDGGYLILKKNKISGQVEQLDGGYWQKHFKKIPKTLSIWMVRDWPIVSYPGKDVILVFPFKCIYNVRVKVGARQDHPP
jgi:hypothetical protein